MDLLTTEFEEGWLRASPLLHFYAFLKFAKKTCPFMRGRENMRSSLKFWRGESAMSRSSRLESGFQDKLVKELKNIFPGCMTFKMDQIQGIPDILVLYKNKWATLELKRSASAKRQPNQEYYVGLMNDMSFSRFIYPENKEEVLNELREAFES